MLDDGNTVMLLQEKQLLSPFLLVQARRIQKRTGGSLFRVLLNHGLVDERELLKTVSQHIGVPCVSLTGFEGEPELLEQLDRDFIMQHRVLPLGIVDESTDERKVVLAMTDPSDLIAIETVSQKLGIEVQSVLVGPRDLEMAIVRCYPHQKDPQETMAVAGPVAKPQQMGGSSEFNFWEDELSPEWDELIDGLSREVRTAERERLPSNMYPDTVADIEWAEGDSESLYEEISIDESISNEFHQFLRRSSVEILRPPVDSGEERPLSHEVKSSKLLEALVEVLLEKGAVTSRELAEALGKIESNRGSE